MPTATPQKSRLRNTRDTASQYFGKSERWLWELSQPRGPIPCIRIGKSVLYDWDQLDQWRAEQQRSTTMEDIQTLHQHCVSVADIASKLHFPESTVRHVIEHGTLPESEPAWQTTIEA